MNTDDKTARKPDQCDRCEHKAMHHAMQHGHKTQLCCECHVMSGFTPADWHSVCMFVHQHERRLTPEEWRGFIARGRMSLN